MWDVATPKGAFSWSSLSYFQNDFCKIACAFSSSVKLSSNPHRGGREWQPEHLTRSRALAQEIFCIFLSVIHPASVIPAEPVPHTHTALAACEEQVWGGEMFACFSLQRLALNLHLECWLWSCSWLSCWSSGWGTEMGTGQALLPSLPPSPPPSPTAAGTNCQGAARPHGFVAFLPLVTNVPPCFRDAVQGNNQPDCLLSGWVPRHLHGQLVWHRSPCFVSDTRGYWGQAGAVLLLLHRCLLLAHLKRTRYPVV